MKTKIGKNVVSGLVVIGLLLCGNARAQIALQDGSLTTAVTSDNSTSVSTSFTVTTGASVLVVSLYDRDQTQNTGTSVSSPSSLSWGSQTISQAIFGDNLASSFADSSIFYLFDPTPGTQTITATDTSGGTPTAMTMQVYDLSGVNTSIAPAVYITNSSDIVGATPPLSLSVNLGAGTPAGAWAVVNASMADSGGGGFNMTASAGTTDYDYVVNNQSQIMGAVIHIAPGASTITENDPLGASDAPQTAFVAAVFTPVPEPSSWPLFIVGAAALGLTTVNRRKLRLSWSGAR
jgi:hypothetical protein